MKIVVAGCGKIGSSIVKYLVNEGHSVTVIDEDENLLNDFITSYDVGAIVGNAAYVSTQQEANVPRCSIFIAVTGNDELNLVSSRVAKSLGAKKTIARVRDTEYTDQSDLLKESFDIDMIINPELTTAKEIFNILRFPFAKSVSAFENGKAVSVEIKVPEACEISNKSVKDLMTEFDRKIIFAGILRDDELIIPNGESEILSGDRINIISSPKYIDDFFKKAGIFNQKVTSVFIVGGSRISFHLARMLSEDGVEVKIIERDEQRCKLLTQSLTGDIEIVKADGTNEQILDEEGISTYSACVALTNHDEENILVSLYAKTHSVETIITKINNDRLNDILNELGISTRIQPRRVTVNHILYFTRVMRAKEENTIERLRKTMNDKMEILEFNVNSSEDFTGKSIKELSIKNGILLASIIRRGKAIVPSGDVVIDGDDKIIIATKTNVKSLDRILK